MSLIALTEQLRAGRSVARTLLLLIAVIGAVIVGLLAMHSLNTHGSAADTNHQTAVTAVSGPSAEDHHGGATALDEPCTDCGTNHSDMLTMACVLALLVTVLFLASTRGAQQWLSILPRPRPPVLASLPGPGLRPPSLTALCISRT